MSKWSFCRALAKNDLVGDVTWTVVFCSEHEFWHKSTIEVCMFLEEHLWLISRSDSVRLSVWRSGPMLTKEGTKTWRGQHFWYYLVQMPWQQKRCWKKQPKHLWKLFPLQKQSPVNRWGKEGEEGEFSIPLLCVHSNNKTLRGKELFTL